MIWRYTSLCIYLPFQTQNTSSKSRYGRGKSHTGMVYSSIYFDLCNFGQLGLYNARMKYMHFNMNIKFCLRSRWKWPAYRLLLKLIDYSFHDFILWIGISVFRCCSDISSLFVFTISWVSIFFFFCWFIWVFFSFSMFLTQRQKNCQWHFNEFLIRFK